MIHRVILADNQSVFRTGAARIMAMEEDIRVIGQCEDDARLMKALSDSAGAVVMYSTTLHPQAGSLIKSAGTNARIIAILENDDQPQQYLRDGILGVVYRDVANADLLRCVRSVARRNVYVQSRATGLEHSFESDLVATRVQERLSPKELQILGLIIQGYKNKDIAVELHNSEQVIRNYMRSIFDKTGVSDRLELALFTVHHKLLANAAMRANAEANAGSSQLTKQRNAIAS